MGCGRNTEGCRGGAHSIKYPVVTLGDYFQILSNELSISVPPPPSQPFQLSNHFYITFCTTSHGAKAKTNACEKYGQHTSGVRSSLQGLRRWNTGKPDTTSLFMVLLFVELKQLKVHYVTFYSDFANYNPQKTTQQF